MQVVASKADGAEGGTWKQAIHQQPQLEGGTASPARADGTAPPTPLTHELPELPAEPRQAVWSGRTLHWLGPARLQPGFIGALETERGSTSILRSHRMPLQ